MNTSIIMCTEDDLPALVRIGIDTYRDSFEAMNATETMQNYLDEAFSASKIRRELRNPKSHFYFLRVGSETAGYLKLNTEDAQTDLQDPQALEIERIYLRREHQGCGFGHALIQFSLDEAVAEGKTFLWLGVWEKNVKARIFYERHGFVVAGTHSFRMGNEIQTDFIMKRNLSTRSPGCR